jgi:glucan phosphoethanolaminetransferase (alkaline phosphatase superfamily)
MNEAHSETVSTVPLDKAKWRGAAWLALLLIILLALASVFIPAWVIMPFKAQTTRGVAVSYALKSWSPLITLLAVLLTVALAVYLWRGARWFGRAAMIVLLVPAFIAAWFARQNHFEWMFNPLTQTAYARVSEADFVNDQTMMMAVTLNGEAAAYPIRQMAYHHIAQDTVGGVPIVATY